MPNTTPQTAQMRESFAPAVDFVRRMSEHYRATEQSVTPLVGGLVADVLTDSRTGSVAELHADILSAAAVYDGVDPLQERVIQRERRYETAEALRRVARALLTELGLTSA